MPDSGIFYATRPGTTPEAELDALASVYRFILDCRAKKEGGPETAPKDAKGSLKHEDRASTSIQE